MAICNQYVDALVSETLGLGTDIQQFMAAFLAHPAILRLKEISFLGALSPKYALKLQSPLYTQKEYNHDCDDGSRFDHSVHVAALASRFCTQLNLPNEVHKYALLWGLCHDIGTWPLSHTGEPAFSVLTNTTSSRLRQLFITRNGQLPERLLLTDLLCTWGIKPNSLLDVLNKELPKGIDGIQPLVELIRSPITPDTMEGMWRSGKCFSVHFEEPEKLIDAVHSTFFGDSVIAEGSSKEILTFWRRKSTIYNRYINSQRAIRWESQLASALFELFDGISLQDSLQLQEADVVAQLEQTNLRRDWRVFRYKPPLEYYVHPLRKRKLEHDTSLSGLERVLRKRVF
jgi:hypothetical protein